MDLLEGIRTRRSIRKFTGEPVAQDRLQAIISAGACAPSGLNNQPWRFVIVTSRDARASLAAFTSYGHIIEAAPACIAVFIDRTAMYHEVKDHQAMGACIQNMLLASHGMGLGAVWLGEILKNADAVRGLLGLPDSLELMAVIALGHPAEQKGEGQRKPLAEVLVKEV